MMLRLAVEGYLEAAGFIHKFAAFMIGEGDTDQRSYTFEVYTGGVAVQPDVVVPKDDLHNGKTQLFFFKEAPTKLVLTWSTAAVQRGGEQRTLIVEGEELDALMANKRPQFIKLSRHGFPTQIKRWDEE
eukprot:GHVS01093553.1.p2 GENE.GHVS01093553.1~~GHVS01093553.1.p2  ORF type:complete len:129 (+),score=17.98 GHVS01093553.1:79-465(+)